MAGRSSLIVRLARHIQAFPLWMFRFFEWPFVALFGKQLGNTPAIFVLALPRSGSTVTYQSICHGLNVNYLSNLWHLFYQLPLIGGWLSARKAPCHYSDFKSQQGFVPGPDGPAEGLHFWQYWLDCGLSDRDCEVLSAMKRQKRASYLRRVFSVLAGNSQSFATAYLGHTLMPDRVNEAFPGAVLIRLHREPVSNALSILKSMRNNDAGWFSVNPQECEGFENTSSHERVAAQVYWLNRRLNDAACANDMLTIHYEKLCEDPNKEMKRIRDWCHKKGVLVEEKFALPEKFQFKRADLESDSDAIKIRHALDRLEAQHGRLEMVK